MSAVPLGFADKTGHIENVPLGLATAVIGRGLNKHVAPEQGLPGGLGCNPHRQVVIVVRTHMQVTDESVAAVQVGFHALPEFVELIAVERPVHWPPVDTVLGAWLFHDESVGGGAACAGACGYQQRTGIGEDALAA